MRWIKDLDIESARYLNLGLASWLLVSVFLWPHSEPHFLVAVFVGALLAVVAPFEMGSPLVRKIATSAGGLLVLATIALPRQSTLTLWHDGLIGLAIVGISFFGPPHGIMPRRPPAPDDAYDGVGM